MTLAPISLGPALIVAPQGRIDQTSAEAFRLALEPHLAACQKGAPALIIDFSGIPYISSVGLRVLMLASRQVAMQQGRLALACLTPTVREVFAISRFDLVLKTFDSVSEAVEALK